MAKETVNYLSRDFRSIKEDLVNWAKTYHSDKIVYFNDANPDIMYLEMVAYVGDMLSFYTDKTFNESFRTTAQAKEALVRICHNLGFYNTGATGSQVEVVLSIDIPFVSIDNVTSPNYSYLPVLSSGTTLKSDSGVLFEILEPVNFVSSANRKIIPNLDGNGVITNYTVTKTVIVKSGQSKIQSFYVSETARKPFLSFIIDDADITEIVGVVVQNGFQTIAPQNYDFTNYNIAYYQVRDLTQSKAFFETSDSDVNSSIKQGVFQSIPKRFIVRRNIDDLVTITFGNQSSEDIIEKLYSPVTADEYFNNVHDDVDLGVLPPVNSTVFIKYRVGGGISTNVSANSINTVSSKKFEPVDYTNINYSTLIKVQNSISVTNPLPASGGRDIPTVEELREISGKTFAAQDRGVTSEDIKAMIQTMPPKFGCPYRMSYQVKKPAVASLQEVEKEITNLTKKMIESTTQSNRLVIAKEIEDYFKNYQIDSQTSEIVSSEPNLWLGEKGLLYILGRTEEGQLTSLKKDSNGILVSTNQILKENIKNYLINKRIIGDWLDIVDGYIYNIQIEFTILADPNNQQQTLIDCLQKLKTYFDVNNWQMGQPIYLANIMTVLQEVNGVINVAELKIINIIGVGNEDKDPLSGRIYQPQELGLYPDIKLPALNSYGNKYEIESFDNIIKGYPESIFEVKYPESDIIGKVYS